MSMPGAPLRGCSGDKTFVYENPSRGGRSSSSRGVTVITAVTRDASHRRRTLGSALGKQNRDGRRPRTRTPHMAAEREPLSMWVVSCTQPSLILAEKEARGFLHSITRHDRLQPKKSSLNRPFRVRGRFLFRKKKKKYTWSHLP